MMQKTVDEQIRETLNRHPIIRLALLFGSVVSGRAHRDSDLDLAVMTERPLTAGEKMMLIADLAEETRRPIDLVDIATVGEPLLGQIIQKGRRIVGNNTQYAQLITRHLLDQADFLPYRSRILAERRRRWIGV